MKHLLYMHSPERLMKVSDAGFYSVNTGEVWWGMDKLQVFVRVYNLQ